MSEFPSNERYKEHKSIDELFRHLCEVFCDEFELL